MGDKKLWDKFDKAIDTEGLADDVKVSAESGYKEVPPGHYEVELNKLELIESKNGDPMVTMWFKILEGDFKGSMIFMNKVVNQGFPIHIVNELLRSMCTEIPTTMEIKFENYRQYGELLMDIFEAIEGKYEFALNYGQDKKGYSTYEIEEVFILE